MDRHGNVAVFAGAAAIVVAAFQFGVHFAAAAVIYDNIQSSEPMTGNQVTFSSFAVGTGSDRLLVVGVTTEDVNGENDPPTTDPVVTRVTYGGIDLSHVPGGLALGQSQTNKARAAADLWYLLAPTSGTASIVVTFQGTVDRTVVTAYSLGGMVQQAPEAQMAKGGNGDSLTADLTTLSPGAVVIDMASHGSGGGFTLASGLGTQWMNLAVSDAAMGTGSHGSSSVEKAIAGAVSSTWALSSGSTAGVAISMAAFAPEPAALGLVVVGLATVFLRRRGRSCAESRRV